LQRSRGDFNASRTRADALFTPEDQPRTAENLSRAARNL
jgi:hypothetical protein